MPKSPQDDFPPTPSVVFPAGYECSFDPHRLDIDLVWRTLAGLYWSPKVRREIIETAIANSIVAGVYTSSGEQVGFARVVTDKATFAWLCDVFVLEAHSGKGIARAMVKALDAHPELQTLRRWMLGTADAHSVYQACGYQALAQSERWMERVNPPQRWQQ